MDPNQTDNNQTNPPADPVAPPALDAVPDNITADAVPSPFSQTSFKQDPPPQTPNQPLDGFVPPVEEAAGSQPVPEVSQPFPPVQTPTFDMAFSNMGMNTPIPPAPEPLAQPEPMIPSAPSEPAPLSSYGINVSDSSQPLAGPLPSMPGNPPETAGSAPSNLSDLVVDSYNSPQENQAPAQPVPQTETLVVSSPQDTNQVVAGNSGGFPKWIFLVAGVLLLSVGGASAYFILGIGQPKQSAEVNQVIPPIQPVIPIKVEVSPSVPALPPVSTGTGKLTVTPTKTASGPGTVTPTGTGSAIDLLRSRTTPTPTPI